MRVTGKVGMVLQLPADFLGFYFPRLLALIFLRFLAYRARRFPLLASRLVIETSSELRLMAANHQKWRKLVNF
jgi:hypothetical protein